jgi:hypothetical protein
LHSGINEKLPLSENPFDPDNIDQCTRSMILPITKGNGAGGGRNNTFTENSLLYQGRNSQMLMVAAKILNRSKQLTMGDPTAFGLGRGVTASHHKKLARS